MKGETREIHARRVFLLLCPRSLIHLPSKIHFRKLRHVQLKVSYSLSVSKSRGGILSGLLLVVTIGCGLALLAMGFYSLFQAFSQRRWVRIDCIILNSKVEERFDNRDNRYFKAVVTYEYVYEGHTNRINIFTPTSKFVGPIVV